MKLVEILAKEMNKWPEDCTCGYCMQACESTEVFFGGPARSIFLSELADDRETAKVTTAQWQAERDRQKGGEWKRARGSKPKYETETPQRMEVRHRDGDIIRGWTSQSWNWSHNDGCPSADIMAWRIISQPQAEEVEVKGTTIGTLSYKVDVDTSAATQAVDDLAAKWDQIETPFKWRDEVTELNAYIEKYTRERDAIIERLASEGFALIPPVVSVVSEFSGADMSDWRNWQAGDIVECVTGGYTGVYTKGNQYKVEWVKEDCFSVYDDCGEKSSCDWFDHDAEGLKFVRRP